MEDRRPQNPGRVKITPESGSPYFATVEMADNPLAPGTPLNAETLLTDETAEKIGLAEPAERTPDRAFNKIWDRVREISAGTVYPKSIEITKPPRKTEYLPLEFFDPTGMVAEVIYSNGARLEASGYSWTPSEELTEGTSKVTISYTESGKTVTADQTISVVRGVVEVPTFTGSLTYSGSPQSPTWQNYDPDKMAISGNTSETDAGSYTAIFTPTIKYKWPDGGTEGREVPWSIQRTTGKVTLTPDSITLDPDHKSATVEISRLGDGAVSVSGGDGIVSTSLTDTALSITSIGGQNGNTTITVTVGQSVNYEAASASVSVSAKFITDGVFTSPQPGVSYTDGLLGLSTNDINRIAMAISNTPSITTTTEAVYADYGATHRKISATTAEQNLSISLNGIEYIFDVIGFNHDDLTNKNAYGSPTATGKAGITFQMHNLLPNERSMNESGDTNVGGWRKSVVRAKIVPEIRGYIPSDWQNVLKKVDKISGVGGGASNGIETTSDDLFLLSEGEIFGKCVYAFSDEVSKTPQYIWYKAGNSAIKKGVGPGSEKAHWWERSPCKRSTGSFCIVSDNGIALYSGAFSDRKITFALCV